MGKRKKPPYFQGDQWFNKKVEGRTREALAQRNGAFAREHKAGSKEALLDYVRSEAARLWFTPNAVEIIGGTYIASRFGGWYQAARPGGAVYKPQNLQRGILAPGAAVQTGA